MRQALLVGIVLISASLFSGCMSVRSYYYHGCYREPRPEGASVEILEPQEVNRAYRVIGEVEAKANRGTDIVKVMERLKRAARRMGGEALVDLQYQSKGTGIPVTRDGSTYVGYVRDFWRGKVIVWEDAGENPE
jgi:hypothetical protein